MGKQADIGLIGLAVMGQNLVLNMNDHGYTVAVYNRTVSKVDEFLNDAAKGRDTIIGTRSIEELVASLAKPRKVMLMVKAGEVVDSFIDLLVPHLETGDVIIDGGNSHFPDTNRRTAQLREKGLLYIGTGVSGGEEGARRGPSIMPGGNKEAWPLVKNILQDISAKVDDGSPCCDWVGEDGAGHYVKMVHNGIEYGMMQSLAEGFTVLRKSPLGLDLTRIADLYNHRSVIESRLTGWLKEAYEQYGPDLNQVSGSAAQSGEGKWTVDAARELGVAVPVIEEALAFRLRSLQHPSYTGRVISALRHAFGGHDVKEEK
ncbi:MAG TPA: hypothetical protein DEZ27_02165 [Sphaerochaeta sp.]|nr:hypothetical protein [Sphaerochaeta sp.]